MLACILTPYLKTIFITLYAFFFFLENREFGDLFKTYKTLPLWK